MPRYLMPWVMLCLWAPVMAAAQPPQHVIVDTDIGADIDDVLALLLALRSPELQIDLVVASYGDTPLKAALARRLLVDAGRPDIPVAAGPATENRDGFALKAWASASPYRHQPYPDAVSAILTRLHAAPEHSVTLIGLAPLTTLDAVMQRDPSAFRQLKKVVLMAGSIYRGYGPKAGTLSAGPTLETNARLAPRALRRLLASGVPVELLPLDATEVEVDGALRARLSSAPAPLGDDLAELYREWAAASRYGDTPVAFDVVPVARLLDPRTCTPQALHLDISTRGDTRVTPGSANAMVCLTVDKHRVIDLIARRIQ
ncbi:nucleoside hydrolase [Frateuria aurantia]